MQLTGHTAAQRPQSMHAASSIFLIPSSSSLMHCTGHSVWHAPHAMQASPLILYGIPHLRYGKKYSRLPENVKYTGKSPPGGKY